MNAQQALLLTESKIPSVEEKEYGFIIKLIKAEAEKGNKEMFFPFDIPSGNIMDRLRHEGYRFHIYSHYMFPDMYSISWGKEEEKKKSWLQKLFNGL